ncbi:hypothetical protein ACFFMM_10285 [Micromonospora chaiyaphumensis]|uniref:Uncharacterized protein n=1 Tax=Micromonospora chaiyaphumensis TaxID=307119 RepID=A0A1C4XXG1_9ACTN|nr:hypothetical protein [Micromonospora chaiyaphumensis]SCF13135.1 hypothetical protein GA0070214_106471 [Micromonospora chaiyaphumensis]
MMRRVGLGVVVVAALLAASACGDASEMPATPTAAEWSASAESLAPTPTAAPAATPSRAPEPSPTPRSSKAARSSTAPAPAPTTKKATQAATTSNKAACTAVKGPLEKAIAGLAALVIIAGSATSETEVAAARTETITRLVDLEAVANKVAAEQTDRTLRSNFRALAVAADRKYAYIRAVRPFDVEGLVSVASDTSALESAVNKLEPACGKYW